MPDIHVVNFDRYGTRSWSESGDFRWTLQDIVCPINVREISEAMMSFALGFVRRENEYQLVALLGVGADRNLMLGEGGRWAGDYLPECYRHYPFLLAKNESGDFVLCIDEGSGLVREDAKGNSFFEDATTPTKKVGDTLNALVEQARYQEMTKRVCEELDNHGLIKPWNIKVRSGDDTIDLDGLYMVDEAGLNELAPDALVKVRDAGGLALAFAQLFSRRHLLSLSSKTDARVDAAMKAMSERASTPSLGLHVFEDNGNITFE